MSLRLKTILGIACIKAVLLVILIFSVLKYMRDFSEQSMIDYANTTSTLFSTSTKNAIMSYDIASLESFVSEILKNKGVVYARVLNADHQVLAQGGNPVLLDKKFVLDHRLTSVNDGVFDTFSNVEEEGEALYGRVEVGISIEDATKTIADTRKTAAFIALVEMVLVAIFSFILSLYLTRQLKKLQFAAKVISSGNYNHLIPVHSRDELSEVFESFNKMSQSLKFSNEVRLDYQQQLELLNANLEIRVKEQTKQLSQSNQELSTAYKKLKSTQQQLLQSEKMASLGQMAAGVAHEINNPLGFVKGNLDTLSEYFKVYQLLLSHYKTLLEESSNHLPISSHAKIQDIKDLEISEDIDFIKNDVNQLFTDSLEGMIRVGDIARGLKSFARADNHSQKETLDIHHCINTALRFAKPNINPNCKITTQFGSLPQVNCHQTQLIQVFTNFVVNASQAIHDEGEINIRTERLDEYIRISIKDNGEGINQEHLKCIFDPFFTTKPVGKGTGLGLSISHGIIKEHQGDIQVISQKNIGTEFIISLPIAG